MVTTSLLHNAVVLLKLEYTHIVCVSVKDSLVGSLLQHVGSYVFSDVPEERTTSIFRVTELSSCGYLSDWQDEMARLYRKVAGIHTLKSKVHTKLSD